MAYNINLTGKNKTTALLLLKNVADVLNSCKIQYWLDGGTLLGIVRENRLLPWDDDVDLSILHPEKKELKKLIATLKEKGFRVRSRKIDATDSFFKKGQVRVIKIRNKQLFGLKKSPVCLEIFIRYIKENYTYCKIGNTIQKIPLSYCNPLKTISFNNNNYNIPLLTDKYLTHKYGDWKKTVKEWSVFEHDKSTL